MGQFEGLRLFGEGRTVYSKELDPRPQNAKVLIVVKASPNPSTKYGDTVCVAGIRMREDGPEWIRLYPVPFRSLERADQFRKYELLEMRVAPNTSDPRPESYRPDLTSPISHLQHLAKWEQRHPYFEPLTDQWTMCSILQARMRGEEYPSLAVVRPRQVKGMVISDHEGWSPQQVEAMQGQNDQGSLFATEQTRDRQVLKAPRFKGLLRYTCMETGCRGHAGSINDWEFTALQRSVDHKPEAQIKSDLEQKFLHELCSPHRGPLFIVGNQQKRPQAFSILGVYRTQ